MGLLLSNDMRSGDVARRPLSYPPKNAEISITKEMRALVRDTDSLRRWVH